MSLANVLVLLAIGMATVAALAVALSWLIAWLWCKPKRQVSSKAPADYGLPCEPIQFSSSNVPLRGWFVPAVSRTPPAPAVILVHGWSRNAADMLPAAWALHRAGFAVALYDARGHGVSGQDGPITILKFAEDVRACLDYLGTRADVDQCRVGILGHSLGGSGALLSASMDTRIRAVVSCSAFSDPRTITADFLRRLHIPAWPFLPLVCRFIERWLGTSLDNVAPARRVSEIKVPLLLLHGDDDRFIPPAHMDAIYANSRHDQVEMRRLSNRRHADVTTDAACGDAIVSFFGRHLYRAAL